MLFRSPSLIDVFWGINITLTGLIYLSFRNKDMLFILSMMFLVIWGLRLTSFLFFSRIVKGKHDPRYEEMSRSWKNKKLGFLAQYLLQGCLAWIIATPFFLLKYKTSIEVIDIVAFLVILIGIVGEAIADYQLYTHVKMSKGTVCQKGLWRYTRHPNYFFECTVWLGFSMLGSFIGLGFISYISILTLFCIMWFVTIPITENESIKKRGEAYLKYKSKTPCLIPWVLRDKKNN